MTPFPAFSENATHFIDDWDTNLIAIAKYEARKSRAWAHCGAKKN